MLNKIFEICLNFYKLFSKHSYISYLFKMFYIITKNWQLINFKNNFLNFTKNF